MNHILGGGTPGDCCCACALRKAHSLILSIENMNHNRIYFLLVFSGIFLCVFESLNAQSSLYRSQYDGVRKSIDKSLITAVDSARVKITYSLKYVPDSTNPKNVLRDKKILLVGNKVKHFYSDYIR